MLAVLWFVLAVVAAVLLTTWVTFTITRLDRLHARVDAAQAALDAQLVRRAAALQHVLEYVPGGRSAPESLRLNRVAQRALDVGVAAGEREAAENAVGRAVAELSMDEMLAADAMAEVREAAARVLIARRFYNDAVRDTRSLRARRMPRLLHLAGRRDLPDFFDIDDTLPAAATNVPGDATLDDAPPPRSAAALPAAPAAPQARTEEESE